MILTRTCVSVAAVLCLTAFAAPVQAAAASKPNQSGRVSVAGVLDLMAAGAPVSGSVFNDPNEPEITDSVIDANRDRMDQLMDASAQILAKAEAESRDLTTAEQKEVGDLNAEFEDLENQNQLRIRSLKNAAYLQGGRGRRTAAADDVENEAAERPAARAAAAGREPQRRVEPQARSATARGTAGFRNLGEFADKVRMSVLGRETDPRLRNAAASTYGNEATGAEGGFGVPTDFRTEIAAKVFGEDSLASRTDRVPTTGNKLVLPSDMTTPWDSTGGIQAYWGGEAAAMTQSKPKLEDVEFKASKLHVLVPVTEELLEDAPAMDAYLRRKAPEKIDFKLSDAIVRGNGVGMPLGFLNSDALVTQAAEGGQAADTVVQGNISKMWSRMPIQSRRNAVWLINPDVEPQLDGLTVGQQPVYMPPGGLSDTPYGRLKGRPVIPHQVCATLGDVGDIMLVDLEQYLTLIKQGGGRDANGVKFDISMHLWFDQDLLAFKWTLRIGGQPWWSAPTSPKNGSNTQSPFVALAAR
jgi:HK97 family phage major capsid protein